MEVAKEQNFIREPSYCLQYVQDGLIAMFDAYENAGHSWHKNKPNVIANLCKTGDLALVGDYEWFEDEVFFKGGYGIADFHKSLSEVTIEIVTSSAMLYGNQLAPAIDIRSGTNGTIGMYRTEGSSVMCYYAYPNGSFNRQSYRIGLQPNVISFSSLGLYLDGVSQTSLLNKNLKKFDADTILICTNNTYTASSDWSFKHIRVYDRPLPVDEALHNYEVDKMRFGI